MRKLKLGSLFDGSGGFPLAGVMNGIEPVWASEIEPFPIRVTKQRFPNMKHLGSVTDINGAEIEPVDIITFGSPCQDLSVAGKQAGIHDGERSSLFFEAVRIIREMREHDRAIGRADVDIRPRFAVWENVPGAFSSNKGADFQAVLQALCEIEGGETVSVPLPKDGKWTPAGCVVGDGYSIAWRVYDAQFWGVPQRRKRIYLIADFATERAGEILFESEGVSGDHQQSKPAGKGTAEDAEGSTGRSDSISFTNGVVGCDMYNQKLTGNKAATLQEYSCETATRSGPSVLYKLNNHVRCLNPWDVQSKHIMTLESQSEALCSGEKRWGALPPNVCYPVAFMGGQGAKARSIAYHDDGTTPTIKSVPSGSNTIPDVCYSIEGNTVDRDTKKNGCGYCQDVSPTLNTQDKHAVTYAIEGNGQRESHKGDGFKETDTMYTLNTIEQHAVAYGVDCRNGVLDEEKTHTVQAHNNDGFSLNCTPSVVYGIENHPADSRCDLMKGDKCQTLTSRMGTGGNNVPMLLVLNDQGGAMMDVSDRSGCLRAQEHGHQPIVCYERDEDE